MTSCSGGVIISHIKSALLGQGGPLQKPSTQNWEGGGAGPVCGRACPPFGSPVMTKKAEGAEGTGRILWVVGKGGRGLNWSIPPPIFNPPLICTICNAQRCMAIILRHFMFGRPLVVHQSVAGVECQAVAVPCGTGILRTSAKNLRPPDLLQPIRQIPPVNGPCLGPGRCCVGPSLLRHGQPSFWPALPLRCVQCGGCVWGFCRRAPRRPLSGRSPRLPFDLIHSWWVGCTGTGPGGPVVPG